jgi:hypothetical protein
MGHKPHKLSATEQADALEQVEQVKRAKRIRTKVEAADDTLTQALVDAQALDESTLPVAVAQAMRDADLADAVAGKARQVADLLRESVTPPVVG